MFLETDHTEPIAEESDEAVLARSIDDPEAFSVLLDRYQEAFIRKAQAILHNRDDAQEVVQEAFTKIYVAAPRFREMDNGSFRAWGYKILMNTAFTRYQKLKKERGARAAIDPEFYESLPDREDDTYFALETSEYVLSVFAKMPDHLARVLRLHFLEGKPQQEVADIEGLSVGAVKTRVHRAKKEFKRILSSTTS